MAVIAPSTKEQIVLAAERLFAERGIEGVSLRQIGAAAGQRQQLGGAVPLRLEGSARPGGVRVPPARASASGATSSSPNAVPTTSASWVECEARWMFEQSELDDSNYMSFVAMLTSTAARTCSSELPDDLVTSTRDVPRAHLRRCSGTSPSRCAPTASAGDGARWCTPPPTASGPARPGQPVLPFAVALGDLVDGIVGFLEAPVSAASLEALERAESAAVTWPTFL